LDSLVPPTLFASFLVFVVAHEGIRLADIVTKAAFAVVSWRLPRRAFLAYRNEVLNHLLEEVFRDSAEENHQALVFIKALGRIVDLGFAAPSERSYYLESTAQRDASFDDAEQLACSPLLRTVEESAFLLVAWAGVAALVGIVLSDVFSVAMGLGGAFIVSLMMWPWIQWNRRVKR
jgi:hypothetical protein